MMLAQVRCKLSAGMRRCGITWSNSVVTVELSEEQLAVLSADPSFEVRDASGASIQATETAEAGSSSPPSEELEEALRDAVARIEALEAQVSELTAENSELSSKLEEACTERDQLLAK